MHPTFHYNTVTEAIDELRRKGYTLDFNIKENCLTCHAGNFGPDDFEIKEVYRYEGDTDPADKATVYGIDSHNGMKGILVTGEGSTMDSMTSDMLKKFMLDPHS